MKKTFEQRIAEEVTKQLTSGFVKFNNRQKLLIKSALTTRKEQLEIAARQQYDMFENGLGHKYELGVEEIKEIIEILERG